MLDALWIGVEKQSNYPKNPDMIEISMSLLIDEASTRPWVLRCAANDAATAVVYGLRCWKTGDAQEAAWAARRVYEALDRAVIERSGMDMNAPGAEKAVISDPLIQAELHRQKRDLTELTTVDTREFAGFIHALRARARSEARLIVQALLEISGVPEN